MMATDDLGAVVARLERFGHPWHLRWYPDNPEGETYGAYVTQHHSGGFVSTRECYGATAVAALSQAADRAGVPASEAGGRA
jgi:hypothetical protein